MFKQWCKSQNLFTTLPHEATHLFMDGGMVNVSCDMLPRFLKAYVRFINSGDTICLVEKLGNGCLMRFFLDVDKCDRCDYILDVADAVMGANGRVYGCTQGCGVHIVYDSVVTMHEAREYANAIKLKAGYKGQYIDCSVYASGLRMLGSCKPNTNRWYMPVGNMGDSLSIQMLKESVVRIKSVSVEPNNITNTTQQTIPELAKLANEYTQSRILKVTKRGDFLCLQTDSKYCTNVARNHKSAHVYFVVNKNMQVYQKCHCSCLTHSGRVFSLCSNYKSKRVKLSRATYNNLLNPS